MGFVKVVKNKAYFKRFQVKFRRRRECKTDYVARKRLILQDKNKYKTPKYRFVVRRSHRDIVCQIFSSDLTHDVCLAAAYSHELRRYGVKNGFTNYAAAYCTGLLLARRVNLKFGLDEQYEGQVELSGEPYNVADEDAADARSPFKAHLDVGLARTTTGARLFGALKGACDGGLNIPHNARRFPGSTKEGKEITPNAEVHAKYLVAGHVADYMKKLADDGREDSQAHQFSRYTAVGLDADSLAKMYTDAHAAIRKEPNKKRDPLERGYFKSRKQPKEVKAKKSFQKRTALSRSQRKDRIKQKLMAVGLPIVNENIYIKG